MNFSNARAGPLRLRRHHGREAGVMKDLEERIERAARATWRDRHFIVEDDDVRFLLKEVLPELFGDNPTHWLAPMEATEGMLQAGDRFPHLSKPPTSIASAWKAMRDEYLKGG